MSNENCFMGCPDSTTLELGKFSRRNMFGKQYFTDNLMSIENCFMGYPDLSGLKDNTSQNI